MTITMSLEMRQRAISEWWTEETEYLFQRIERWAACARGYNRLKTQRVSSSSRMTMKESSSSRWSISGNSLFIEEASWNPRLQTLNRSHASKSQPEKIKLNCCGTLNYKSNGKLDSTCLETHSYDHSIHFKTIGDLKRTKNQKLGSQSLGNMDPNQDPEEKIVWQQPKKKEERFNQLVFIESFSEEDVEEYSRTTSSWPEVDLSKLSIDENANIDQIQNQNSVQEFHGNIKVKDENCNPDFRNPLQSRDCSDLGDLRDSGGQGKIKRFYSSQRKSKSRQVVGDDNIVWPGVLLTYRKNVDPAASAAHR